MAETPATWSRLWARRACRGASILLSAVVLAHATPALAISVGQQVQIVNTCGTGLKLRNGPGVASSEIGTNPPLDFLQVIGDGVTVTPDGFRWWQVRDDQNREGWSAVAEWLTPFPSIGITVSVTADGHNLRLRNPAGVTGTLVATMPSGTQMTVVGGPTCADAGTNIGQNLWWQLSGSPGTGWSTNGHWLITTCGNNTKEGSEQCDGSPVGCSAGQTCTASCTCQGGVPPDADGDSVPDASDSCPGTSSGQVVDSAGCSCSDPGHTSCNDGNSCTNDSCNPSTAQCVTANNTVSCDDTQFCTINDACNGAGTCVGGTARDCSAQTDLCNTGVCNESNDQCVQQPRPVSCGDGRVCGTEACDTGLPSSCAGGQTCRASDCGACEILGCTSDTQCTSLANDCNTGVCNLITHACQRQSRPNNTSCTDPDPCTINDRCTAGVCAGGPHCGDDVIQAGCNEECDGSPSDCSTGQTCNASCACIGGSADCALNGDCEDADGCTLDRCVGDSCRYYPAPPGIEGPVGDPTCTNGADDDCNDFIDDLDPRCSPSTSTCNSVQVITYDASSFATSAGLVNSDISSITSRLPYYAWHPTALASDGVSRLLFVFETQQPGDITFSIDCPANSLNPSIHTLAGAVSQNPCSQSVRTTEVKNAASVTRHLGYFIVKSPDHFGDDTTRDRSYPYTIQFTPDPPSSPHQPCSSPERVVRLLRPPVLLVHGFGGSRNTWRSFLNSASPPDSSVHLTFPPAIRPPHKHYYCVADYTGSQFASFATVAGEIARDLRGCLNRFGVDNDAVAIQLDVVAHSMGALATRTLPLCQPVPGLFQDCVEALNQHLGGLYRRPSNFLAGDVRRLVSIDTPHEGTRWATVGLDFASAIVSCPFEYSTDVAGIVDTVLRFSDDDDDLRNYLRQAHHGAVANLCPVSDCPSNDALRTLNSRPGSIPTHFVSASSSADDANSLDAALCHLADYLQDLPVTPPFCTVAWSPPSGGAQLLGSPAVLTDLVSPIQSQTLSQAGSQVTGVGPYLHTDATVLARYLRLQRDIQEVYSGTVGYCGIPDAPFPSRSILSRPQLPAEIANLLDGVVDQFVRVPPSSPQP